ncbi:MAG: hypothetical protein JPMHGGIA_02715 [Saprospiraceae bacterium]|nr:hypothetical protein [Saprospiraceae bacterium]
MKQTFESAYKIVKELAEYFKQGDNHYLSKTYQEAEVRKDFIDKFWIALGWDVHHDFQKNPFEQEVKVEKGVSVSGAQKRADYSFALAPNFRDPKFFVEAKKPAQELYDKDYYFQTVRYGWHKATPLAVLTDFEEFHILDCRFSPDISTILKRQWKRYHYLDYLIEEKFAEIYWLFSREAVLNNSIEKIAESLPKPRGKSVQNALFPLEKHQTIDEDFLDEIEYKREILAKALKKNDDSLDSEQLTEATQKIIDRLVFIRFLEDKLIEHEHHVSIFGDKGKAWDDYIALGRKLDAKYNGIVFKRSIIDNENFKGPVDSEFHSICQDMCHLNSRFLYNEIPIHILGSIYERFLGKVVHATDKRVKVEEKPEVRKAGGVYYTPKYIVDYIVQNTIGKLIDSKTPDQISKMRFVDIACGSGSFLIGVFEYLLDYHNKFYQTNPTRAKKDGCHQSQEGTWVLSIKQKQNILRNNIYGVDIDAQAVEVTQLSLSLKMLEDESTATANEMQVLFHEKILPDMSRNIVCGNSLIGPDILTNDLFSGESDEELKINPMDYESTFPEVIRKGGFDAIVGNPPYVAIKKLTPNHVPFYKCNYHTGGSQLDLFALFIERATRLLINKGLLGYIIPDAINDRSNFTLLRKLILTDYNIIKLVTLNNVFEEANVGSTILIASKGHGSTRTQFIRSNNLLSFKAKEYQTLTIDQNDYFKNQNYAFLFIDNKEKELLDKLYINKIELGSFSFLGRGEELSKRSKLISKIKATTSLPFITGDDISRFSNIEPTLYIAKKNVKKDLRKLYCSKIVVRQVGKNINATYDESGFITPQSVYSLYSNNYNISSYFVLGVLCSRLINFIYHKKFKTKELFPRILLENLKALPFVSIEGKNKTIKAQHDKLVFLVKQMLAAKKKTHSARTDKDKNYYENKCIVLDNQIDNLVYELYGLTPEEISIVEKIK